MINNIEIVPYDSLWPVIFSKAKEDIIAGLGDNFSNIHHIGSTSVQGMYAKPKIDIILVVKSFSKTLAPLEALGYEHRGEGNIPLRHFFRQRLPFNINLHLYEEANPDIELNVLFRDYLRGSDLARTEYIELKKNLLRERQSHAKHAYRLTGYTLGKDIFIRNILKVTGYNGLSLRFCSHHYEWDSYHHIARGKIFQPSGKDYNSVHSNFSNSKYRHFALYKGVEIVAIAEICLSDTPIIKYIASASQGVQTDYTQHLEMLIMQWFNSCLS